MEYEHFGILLQELRKKYNMSRDKLAQNICTPKQIYRIEKGISEPSIYILHQLSKKFNLDLNEYYRMHFTTNTISGLIGINSINAALICGDMNLLRSLIENYENHKDFKKGENLQHIYYGKALCSALSDNNYNMSLEYCYKGILNEYPSFSIENISDNIYSNVGITLLNCISQNFFAMNDDINGMKVLKGLLAVLEASVLNTSISFLHISEFSKKAYLVALYNMGFQLYDQGQIEQSLILIEKGIAYSLKEYNSRHLTDLFFMKFKILYHEERYVEAREYYNYIFSLYKISNNTTELTELESLMRADFSKLLT